MSKSKQNTSNKESMVDEIASDKTLTLTEKLQQIKDDLNTKTLTSAKRKRLKKKLQVLSKKSLPPIIHSSNSNEDSNNSSSEDNEKSENQNLIKSPVARHIYNTHKALKQNNNNTNNNKNNKNSKLNNENSSSGSESETESSKEENFDLEENLLKNMNTLEKELGKYYGQRYRLFSKFDDGILLDKESWFSVTPEKIAEHIAERCKCNFILDAFCGAGGNTIQFAKTCNHVLSVDIDRKKLMMASHNLKIYDRSLNVDLIHSDFMLLSNSIQGINHVNAIFLSPPWGGPSYLTKATVSLDDFTPNGFEIFTLSMKITPNIAYFLPRNIDHLDLAKLTKISKEMGGSDHCEVEENYLNGVLKTITVYFGNLIKNQ